MRSARLILALTVACLLVSPMAQAQQMKIGLSGLIETVSATVPANGATAVFTAPTGVKPDTGFFVVTQICVEDRGGVDITGSTLGLIPLDDDCQTFHPGLALPTGETLTATDTDGGTSQAIVLTGVRMKK